MYSGLKQPPSILIEPLLFSVSVCVYISEPFSLSFIGDECLSMHTLPRCLVYEFRSLRSEVIDGSTGHNGRRDNIHTMWYLYAHLSD